MKCPHCLVAFHDNWQTTVLGWQGNAVGWSVSTAHCPSCKKFSLSLQKSHGGASRLIVPDGTSRNPVPADVPQAIAVDYEEACLVLSKSAKASAALSRRCLQHILQQQGYSGRDLAKQVDAFLAETDPSKIAPLAIRDVVDSIRNFGNFSAHPITDTTTLQIIDVEPHEAEQCLEVIETLFDFFYVQPAEVARRKAALNAKLSAAGKPPAKS